ncbi:hypothetical protein B4585_10865 [Lacticaseibacillus paracasei]|nr:hypothetical protein B4585_10865 [Lacticaseibacillus paracasei]
MEKYTAIDNSNTLMFQKNLKHEMGRTISDEKRIKIIMDNTEGRQAQRLRVNGNRPHDYVRT